MKRGLLGLLGVVVLLALTVLARTLSVPSRQVDAEPAPAWEPDANRVAQRLGMTLRLRTISYQDRERLDAQAFREFGGALDGFYPRVRRALEREKVNGLSLLYTWKGSKPELPPVLLAAHQDVVPVDPASRDAWTHPPFEGVVADGVVWGRGSLDDKASVICIVEAVDALLAEGFVPERTVYLAFGHDEEVGGAEGARAMAELLAKRGVRLAWVLDEGGLVVRDMLPGVPSPVAVVGVAEKGAVSIGLKLDAPGGHSSTPPPHTAIGDLAAAVVRIERNPMPARIDGVTADLLDALAPELPFPARLVVANRWLFGPFLRWGLEGFPPTAAMLRTTTAVTMFNAGVKENVLPTEATAVVNFRIHPRDSIQKVVEHVERTIDDDRIDLQVGLRTKPREPSPVSPIDGPAFAGLAHTIRSIFPEAVVAPYLVVGGTDSRHYGVLSENVYRFMPFVLSGDDTRLAHGTDEHITVENLGRGVRFYRQLLLDAAGPAQPPSE